MQRGQPDHNDAPQRDNQEHDLCVDCSHLSVRAVVQSPQVCLLSCELLFSELYIGVAAQGTVTIFNQTLLHSPFSWMVRWLHRDISSPLHLL